MTHLLNKLFDFHQIGSKRVILRVDSDDVALPIQQALPLSLILNELTSNALKHAFPNRREGAITVTLRHITDGPNGGRPDNGARCELSVHDNGVGVGGADKFWQSSSIGLRIVRLLTQQLQGGVTFSEEAGTRVSVHFPLAGQMRRHSA